MCVCSIVCVFDCVCVSFDHHIEYEKHYPLVTKVPLSFKGQIIKWTKGARPVDIAPALYSEMGERVLGPLPGVWDKIKYELKYAKFSFVALFDHATKHGSKFKFNMVSTAGYNVLSEFSRTIKVMSDPDAAPADDVELLVMRSPSVPADVLVVNKPLAFTLPENSSDGKVNKNNGTNGNNKNNKTDGKNKNNNDNRVNKRMDGGKVGKRQREKMVDRRKLVTPPATTKKPYPFRKKQKFHNLTTNLIDVKAQRDRLLEKITKMKENKVTMQAKYDETAAEGKDAMRQIVRYAETLKKARDVLLSREVVLLAKDKKRQTWEFTTGLIPRKDAEHEKTNRETCHLVRKMQNEIVSGNTDSGRLLELCDHIIDKNSFPPPASLLRSVEL
jgi:hypothetical protein